MACLFGYCGPPADGLLARMAGLLAHRCPSGWERARGATAAGDTVEIGHGVAAWNRESQLARRDSTLLGYGGVLFETDALLERDDSPIQTVAARLLAGLRSNPTSSLARLTGVFVLAMNQGDAFYLVRDPAGVKVLYWTVHQGRLLFASEIKALFADPTLPRRMRAGALPEYLSFSFIPGANTLFADIEELPPGSILEFRHGQARVRRHFRVEDLETDASRPAEDYPLLVRAALEQSVAECLAVCSGKPPVVFLSGGIDSSAVLAVAGQQLSGTRIPTFSVHFGAEYARENEFVQMMVDRYQTDHHWLEVRPAGFLDQLREIIWRLDDPIGDPVTVPNDLLARAAAQVADVVLNGEGGDPCLGGPKNIPMLLARLYGPLPGEPAAGWLERNYLRAFQRCYQDLNALLDPALLREAGGDDALVGLLEPYFQAPTPRDFVNKLTSINIRLKGANLILVKVEKMTAGHGVLALPPLFSRRIIETSMACPPALRLEGAVEKSVLKKAVRDLVPEAIIARPKSGMMVPVRFWFQGEMRRYGQHLLTRANLQRLGLFDPDYVQRLLDYEMEGVPGLRHGLKLWMLVTFLLWYEQMVEAPLPSSRFAPPREIDPGRR
ncbi:MAG: asparagine synthase [Candidatus Competibacteraceae bacterium]|nr:MAG: asparagine synthase [Candidatus Competibacteraceae bacterium]